MRSTRMKVTGVVVALAVLGAGCSDDGGGAGGDNAAAKPVKYDASEKVASPAVDLRADLTALLQENVLLTGITTSAVIAGQDSAPASAVLDQNNVALADVITGLYGPPAGQQFLDLWRRHSATVLEFAAGSVAADQARIAKAKTDATAVQAEVATLLNSVNPQLTTDALTEPLESLGTMLQGAVTAQAKKDATAPAKLKEAAHQAQSAAIVIVAGIAKHKAKKLPGEVGAMSAVMRTSLTAKLQEHVYLAGLATATALSGGQVDPATKALDENSLELSRAIGSVYGDDVAKEFLTLWRQHVGFIVDFTAGAAAADPVRMNNARSALDGYRTAFGAFLSSANPNFAKDAVTTQVGMHVDSLLAAVEAQADKHPDHVLKLREAAGHMPELALFLATGIARQFPTKFG